MKYRFTAFILFTLISFTFLQAYSETRPRRLIEMMDSLDLVLRHNENFATARLSYVDSVRNSITARHTLTAKDCKALGDAFNGMNADSARIYYSLGIEAAKSEGDIELMRLIMINHATQMSKIAMFSDAMRILDTIPAELLSRPNQIKYYSAVSQINIDAGEYAATPAIRQKNINRAIEALDSLSQYFPKGHFARRMTEAQLHFLKGDKTLALGELNEVFDSTPTTHPSYAILAAMLAHYYKDNPETRNEYLYYLAISSIADIKNANGEAVSLATLGNEMFKDGDLERASLYLTASGEAIDNSQSRILIARANPSLASLAKVLYERQNKKKQDIRFVEIALLLIICVLSFLLWRSSRSSRKDELTNKKLKDSISVRDSYINQLLSLCSVYIEGLEDFNRLVGRKLKANQTQDLYKLIESGKMLQDQTERFFTVFDTAMLKIFPNFVDDVNTLLQPDKQISLLTTDKLTPELRILAFMRLGVCDSTRISKFLGLSLNTVYTYRNRMKSRAKNRENFESDVLNIGK